LELSGQLREVGERVELGEGARVPVGGRVAYLFVVVGFFGIGLGRGGLFT